MKKTSKHKQKFSLKNPCICSDLTILDFDLITIGKYRGKASCLKCGKLAIKESELEEI